MTVVPEAGEVFYGDDGSVSVVLPNTYGPNVEITQEELEEYAEWIGIDVKTEPHLMWIAREGLRTPLPDEWRACRTSEGEVYYFNFRTGESVWDHPMDDVFQKKVEEERARLDPGGKRGVGKKEAKIKDKVLSDSFELEGKKGGVTVASTEKRRLEKGAAGNVDSPKKATRDASLFASSQLTSLAPVGMSTPNVRLGRLGALGTPEATRRLTPDVSGILLPSKGSTAAGMSLATKVPSSVKELEMNIRQRVDDEIEARRRAMRLRHQKQIMDERAAMENQLKIIKKNGEDEIAAEERRGVYGEKSGSGNGLEVVQKALEKQHAEAKARVASLQQTLQRERTVMENTLQQRLAQVKEELLSRHKEKINSKREESLAQLEKEKARLSQEHLAQLEAETQKLTQKVKEKVEEIRKAFESERSKLEKELASGEEQKKREEERRKALAEAERAREGAIRQAKLDAAGVIEAIRKDYCAEMEKLKALKEKAIEKRLSVIKTRSSEVEKKNKQLEEEEESFKKALEERVAQFMAETQKMLAAKQLEVGKLQKTLSDLRVNDSSKGEVNKYGETAAALQEQYSLKAALHSLESAHTQAMEQIRREHEEKLSKLGLFNPRHSDGYDAKLREQQAAWVKAHPASAPMVKDLEPVSASSSALSAPVTNMFKEEKLKRINATVADAMKAKASEAEKRLADEEMALAGQNKSAVEEYRLKRMRELDAQLVRYRNEHAARHQQRLDSIATALSEEPMAFATQQSQASLAKVMTNMSLPERLEKTEQEVNLNVNEIDMEEAKRQETELRQRMCIRIETLQKALQSARDQLQQRKGETSAALSVASTAAPVSWQRPPPVPVSKLSFGCQDQQQQQQLTPRTFRPGQQPCGSATPMLNHTLSTIPSANSLWSSAQPSPTRPVFLPNAGSAASAVAWQEGHTASLRNAQQNAVFEDRLRRASLLLKEKKKRVTELRANMERARKIWRRDMEDCRTRHDRGSALMLWQIKKALEAKAEQINREVISLKKATLWLREREAVYRRTQSLQIEHMAPGSEAVVPATCEDVSVFNHVIQLLNNILTSTEVMKSYLTSPGKETTRSLCKNKKHSHSNRHLSPKSRCLHKREKNRHVDILSSFLNEEPVGVSRWVAEQQLDI